MNPLQAHLISLLHELAHGPDLGAAYGHFSEPGAGFLSALEGISAAQASAPVTAGRPPLAAFMAHLAQLLSFAADQLGGAAEFPNFAAPWQIQALDEAQWRALRQELTLAFASMQAATQRRELEQEELNVAQSTLTHAACHAGAIRFQVQNILAGA